MKVRLLACLLVAGCAAKPTEPRILAGEDGCAQIKHFLMSDLDRYQDQVDEVSIKYQREEWLVETADKDASEEKMSKYFEQVQSKSYDPRILESTRAFSKASSTLRAASCVEKAKLDRALGMLEATILTKPDVIKKEKENQDRQDAMIKQSNGFRMEIPGEKEPVSRAIYAKTLGSTADRKKRESLFTRFNPLRAKKWMEWGFRDLIKARNEEGKAAGFSDYYSYRFFRNELDLENYRSMVKDIKIKLAPKARAVLRRWGKQEGISSVQPWDMRYLREKASSGEVNALLEKLPETAPLDIARRFYSGLGIAIDDYHFTMDLYPRAGKNTHAFAMGIILPHVDDALKVLAEPKPDIRFLANLKKPVKWDDISTVIHELGHAVHGGEVRQPVGLFRGIGSVETEAIAMTMERMADSAEFLKTALEGNSGATPEKTQAILARQAKASRTEQAFVLLRQVFFSDFEYEMYRHPDADFAELWSKMHEEYWGVKVDPKIADWDVEHFLMAPVYVQNYAIGILMVEQIYASMLTDFKTSYRSKELGDKLRGAYFAPGQEFTYLNLTQKFTGKPLGAKDALKLLD